MVTKKNYSQFNWQWLIYIYIFIYLLYIQEIYMKPFSGVWLERGREKVEVYIIILMAWIKLIKKHGAQIHLSKYCLRQGCGNEYFSFFIVLSHQPLKSFVFVCTLKTSKKKRKKIIKKEKPFQVHKFSKIVIMPCTPLFFFFFPPLESKPKSSKNLKPKGGKQKQYYKGITCHPIKLTPYIYNMHIYIYKYISRYISPRYIFVIFFLCSHVISYFISHLKTYQVNDVWAHPLTRNSNNQTFLFGMAIDL